MGLRFPRLHHVSAAVLVVAMLAALPTAGFAQDDPRVVPPKDSKKKLPEAPGKLPKVGADRTKGLDFLFGIFLVWLYAAIRPRFGAGPKTAAIAGVAYWVLFGLLNTLSQMPLGLFPQNLAITMTAVTLVEAILATLVGAKLYSESA